MAIDWARANALLRDRVLGFTYQEMAERHGYHDGSAARQALLRALDRHQAATVAELRTVENERYEEDYRQLRLIINDRNTKAETRIHAIDARTRAAARHARLNGLDAPLQVSINPQVDAAFETVVGEVVNILSLVQPDPPEPGEETLREG